MSYKISRNVPIPLEGGSGRGEYPFPDMEVGDSFVGPVKARIAASNYGKRHGIKFTSRKEGDGVRIWRIK